MSTGSSYDPATGIVSFGAGATLYDRAHEYAHQTQQRHGTRAFRVSQRIGQTPYLCRIARLWLEWEAARLALRALEGMGRCGRAEKWEANKGLRSYLWALFEPPWPLSALLHHCRNRSKAGQITEGE